MIGKFTKAHCENGEELYREFREKYNAYRSFCLDKCMWNNFLQDRQIFVGTDRQLYLEGKFLDDVRARYQAVAPKQREYKLRQEKTRQCGALLLERLRQEKKGVAVLRAQLIRELAGEDQELRNAYGRACNALVREGKVTQGKDEKDRVVIKARSFRMGAEDHRDEPDLRDLFPSVYLPQYYSEVTYYDVQKALMSVDSPEELDQAKKYCVFHSHATGEKYYTSLSGCTCPFDHTEKPCKHMIRLAIKLGYFKPPRRAAAPDYNNSD